MLNIERITNCTPHTISIIAKGSCTFDKSIRKWVSDAPVVTQTLEPSGVVLSAKFEDVEVGDICGIPGKFRQMVSCDQLPESVPELEEAYIVSALYANASRHPNLFTVIDPVYTLDGSRILGCLSIGFVSMK